MTAPLASTIEQRATRARLPLRREFADAIAAAECAPFEAATVTTLRINVGKLCNQTCRHCHVDAGPDRREVMSRETMQVVRRCDRADRHRDGRHPAARPS